MYMSTVSRRFRLFAEAIGVPGFWRKWKGWISQIWWQNHDESTWLQHAPKFTNAVIVVCYFRCHIFLNAWSGFSATSKASLIIHFHIRRMMEDVSIVLVSTGVSWKKSKLMYKWKWIMPKHAHIIPATTPRLPTVSDGRGVFAEFVSSPCSALWGFHPHSPLQWRGRRT